MTTSQSTNFKYVYSDGDDIFDYVTFFKNNFQKTDDLMFNGSQRIKALPTPAVPTIVTVGTVGTTSYSYYVVAVDKTGNKTLPSPVGTITTGNATLSATNYNTITWTAVTGAVSYDILKGDTGHSIATGVTGTTLNDTGQATAVYTVPTRNATGDLTIDGNLILPPVTWTNAPLFTASSWSAASGQTVPAYIVDNGWISFRGAATGGAAGSWVVLMTTGLKIEKTQKFLCATNASNGVVGVTVNPDGSFVVDSALTGGAWVDLSAIRYKTFA